jgi:hypothetical protein
MRMFPKAGGAAIALLVTALAGHVLHAAEPALQRRSLLGGRVSILMPADFTPMSAGMVAVKYPVGSPPSHVYTNADSSVNLTLNHTPLPVKLDELGMVLESLMTHFKTTYPAAAWFRSEMRTIQGRPFALVELRTTLGVAVRRNIIVATSLDDRLLMITFNVDTTIEAQWLAAGNRIIESIGVK